jgi:hypothetical protein
MHLMLIQEVFVLGEPLFEVVNRFGQTRLSFSSCVRDREAAARLKSSTTSGELAVISDITARNSQVRRHN